MRGQFLYEMHLAAPLSRSMETHIQRVIHIFVSYTKKYYFCNQKQYKLIFDIKKYNCHVSSDIVIFPIDFTRCWTIVFRQSLWIIFLDRKIAFVLIQAIYIYISIPNTRIGYVVMAWLNKHIKIQKHIQTHKQTRI